MEPNHHRDHPGFAGCSGFVAALTFSVGREPDADLAVRLAEIGPGDRVVDIGCGPGVAMRRAARAGAASVMGVDPAKVMLRVGRASTVFRSHGADLRFVEGSAEELPLEDAAATVVWSLSTVHHWRDVELGLKEAHRVLAPGGRLLAIERRVKPGATGHASHGWADDQAEAFGAACESAGFVDVAVAQHQTSRPVLTVLAHTHEQA
ncbi:MAG TPA: class I SAM-dependent methyltransferase [Acidimicrobiales bacterium]|nr:class I SAM-dependent methyltransferase [Acidimicrobiales bacterium]